VAALAAAMSVSADNLPGVVVLDGKLLAGEGWKLLRALRNNGSRREVQLLMFSLSRGQDESAPVPDYLSKPVGTGEMAQALRRRDVAKPDDVRTVLVVDDDPDLLGMHAHIVQSLSPNYCVLTAASGAQALNLIQQHDVDLVLLDLMMPNMDGFGVIDAMQKSETARRIPVIVLTGQVLDREDMARLNRGAAEVLQKGVFTVEETLMHIQQTLTHGKKLAGDAQARVRQAMVYMNQHYAEPLTRSDVARHVGISDDHLTRYFHSSLGISPMTYLTRYRVSRAKMLLDEGEMSVASIAGAVGIQNEFYFSRFFRRETGLTPTAYRRGKL
jgi:CheY-like chemotaxis protein